MISAVLSGLPADVDEAQSFVSGVLAIPGVDEAILVLPIANEMNRPDVFGVAEEITVDGFRLVRDVRASDPSTDLNLAAEVATGDVLLILEREVQFVVLDGSAFEDSLVNLAENVMEVSLVDADSAHLQGGISDRFRTGLNDYRSGRVYLVGKRTFLEMRGFDERPEFCTALGRDLLTRFLRAGATILPVSGLRGLVTDTQEPWLFSSYVEAAAESGLAGRISADKSIYRNLVDWSVASENRVPLVSVAVATKDRVELLEECIDSILLQTFQDFEVVVIDDGSDDAEGVRDLIQSYGDERIKLARIEESSGVAAARNLAATISSCRFTAVHDDDDLMLPYRLEVGLASIEEGYQASYGGWINFKDNTGELQPFVTKKDFSSAMVADSGAAPGHSTWTVPTALIRQFKYNEVLTASVDHELATRLVNAGLRWKHAGRYMYLRRVHKLQITAQDSDNQKLGHNLSKINNRFLCTASSLEKLKAEGAKLSWPGGMEKNDMFNRYGAYLPDSLVDRTLKFQGNSNLSAFLAEMPSQLRELVAERDALTDGAVREEGVLQGVTLKQLGELRTKGIARYQLEPHAKGSVELGFEDREAGVSSSSLDQPLTNSIARAAEVLQSRFPAATLIVAELTQIEYQTSQTIMEDFAGLLAARKVLVAGEFGNLRTALVLAIEDQIDFKLALSNVRTLINHQPFVYSQDSLLSFNSLSDRGETVELSNGRN